MSHKTSTDIRMDKQHGAAKWNLLSEQPHLQAEAIATHYIAHAEIAQQLARLIRVSKQEEAWPELNRSIEMLMDEIKRNHLHDFGIALEWAIPGTPEGVR